MQNQRWEVKMKLDIIWNNIKRYYFFSVSALKLLIAIAAIATLTKMMIGFGIDCIGIMANYFGLKTTEMVISIFMFYYLTKEIK